MNHSFFIIACAGYFYLMACLWRDLRRKKQVKIHLIFSILKLLGNVKEDSYQSSS
jgi:hypothetical protein